MGNLSPAETVLRYVEFINKGDPDGVASLTADVFTFTDIPGRVHVFQGTAGIRQCWKEYFTPYPDYKIHVDRLLTGGDGVALIGRTTGSRVASEIEEQSTVLWIAQVRNGLVAEWRIYSDQEYAQRP